MGKEAAEHEIFRLRKRAEAILVAAGDMGEYARIQLTISALQENNNAFYGKEEVPNARGNDTGSQVG